MDAGASIGHPEPFRVDSAALRRPEVVYICVKHRPSQLLCRASSLACRNGPKAYAFLDRCIVALNIPRHCPLRLNSPHGYYAAALNRLPRVVAPVEVKDACCGKTI